jgi:hypothetical protein
MSLAVMATPTGNNRAARAPIALKPLPKNRLTLLPEEEKTAPWNLRGAKLAALDWPPPPSPRGHNHLGGNALGGITPDMEGSEASASSAAERAADKRSRSELWEIRSNVDREKLRMVAPYPFFGCPMRFQDDYAALQVTDDGRFTFSEVSLESVTTKTTVEASEADNTSSNTASKAQPAAPDVKHVVTYEGVFTAPYLPHSDDEEQQSTRTLSKANLRNRSPTNGKRGRADSSPKGSNAGSRAKEANSDEQQPVKPQPEVASIEATALVRHDIIESGGRCRLITVDRGEFSFVITVCPFFHPEYATVKVLDKAKTPGQPPRRSRRLPYVGASSIVGGSGARTSRSMSLTCKSPGGPSKGKGIVGPRQVLSRSLALLPSAAPWNAPTDMSPFRRAGGSLAGRQKVLGSSDSTPNLGRPQGGVAWPI